MYEKAFFEENENKWKNGKIQEHEHVTRELQTLYICKLYILHLWVVPASAIYHFLCCVDLTSEMLLNNNINSNNNNNNNNNNSNNNNNNNNNNDNIHIHIPNLWDLTLDCCSFCYMLWQYPRKKIHLENGFVLTVWK